ncbi:cytochrome P450 86A1 [Xylaria scruposa]|nr:cytochrome P450 86A1 [Xylaria scruposa]
MSSLPSTKSTSKLLHPAGVICALLFGYLIVSYVYCWLRLRHIPGPFHRRFSIVWMVWDLYQGKYVETLETLHAEYGPLVCIGPDWVSLGSSTEIRRVQHHRSAWNRSHVYRGFRSAPGVDSMSTMTDRRHHGQLRSKLEPGYNGKGVEKFHKVIDQHIMKMISVIDDQYATTENNRRPVRPLDLSKMVIYLLVDLISCLSFGRCFGCLERQGDFHSFIKTSEEILPVVLSLAILPIVHVIMNQPFAKVFMPKGGPLGPIVSIAESAVAERFGDTKVVRRDMLGSFVAHGLTREELELETVVQLLGGSETTSTGVLHTMLCLMETPLAYGRLVAEIDHAIQSGRITSSPVADAEAKALPYLQAVIKEGLRLLPPAALIPKSSNADEMICGLRIPAGVSVDLSIKTALCDKAVYGQDAAVFRPERWLEADESSLQLMNETWRIVFGGPSRWECIGKGLALVQLGKLYVELFRRYDFAIANPRRPWRAKGGRIWIITDFLVMVTAKESYSRANAGMDVNGLNEEKTHTCT